MSNRITSRSSGPRYARPLNSSVMQNYMKPSYFKLLVFMFFAFLMSNVLSLYFLKGCYGVFGCDDVDFAMILKDLVIFPVVWGYIAFRSLHVKCDEGKVRIAAYPPSLIDNGIDLSQDFLIRENFFSIAFVQGKSKLRIYKWIYSADDISDLMSILKRA